jgi:chromosome segregation ATPase
LSAALRVELQTAQASLMELRKDMDARVQNLTTEMSAAQNEGSASAAQMATLQGDLEKARIALNAAAAASLSKDAELAALSKELGAGNVARQQAEAAASKERVSYKASYLLTHVVFLAVCVTDRVYICA